MKFPIALMMSAGLTAASVGGAFAQDQTPPSGAANPSSPMSAPADTSGRSAATAVSPFSASPSAKAAPSSAKDAGSTSTSRSND